MKKMKRAKIISFLLAGVLLFQTAGAEVLAAAPGLTVSVTESVQESSAPAELGEDTQTSGAAGEIATDPDTSAGDDNNAQNPDAPAEDNDNAQNPDAPAEDNDNAQDPDAPAEDNDNAQDSDAPAEDNDNAQDPDAPAEDNDNAQDPDAPAEDNDNAQDSDTPAEDNDNAQNPDAPIEGIPSLPGDEDPKESVSANSVSENSVSENSVSENSVSENTLSPEAENAFAIFPGLGDNYTMSSQQMADKRELSAHVGDIIDPNSVKADLFPDAEGLYELGEVVYLAETEAEAEQTAEAFGGVLSSYSYGVAVIRLPQEATVSMAVAAAADSDIKLPAVWPNYYNYVNSDTDVDINGFSTNDPGYGSQWQHSYIGTRYAWAAGYKGKGIKVAVIDSGIQGSHEDLRPAAGKNFCNGAKGTAYSQDNGTHGTHVAGIIAATAGNGKGGAGIAPEATVRSYCVMTKSSGGRSGDVADIMRAVNAAVADGNHIINMSLGSPMYTSQYASVIKKAYDKGVAVFVACGNDDSSACSFPAAYSGAISVAAVDQNGARASFSNFGSTVKLSFPGVGIYSTVPSGYGTMSGTSQASPAAAGTAAVILSADESIRKKTGRARVDALLSKMKSSTIKSSGSGMGAGTTWLPGALKIATDATAPDAPIITIKETPSPKDRSGKTYIAEAVTVTLTAKTAVSTVEIWYNTEGKTPSYKNGVVTNAEKYTKPFSTGGAKTKTVKAIVVNPYTGKASKAVSKTCKLTPIPTKVNVTATGNVTRIAAGKSLKLSAAVTPSYAVSTKAAWSVNDAAKAAGITVSSGTVKTKSTTPAGKYTVTATAVGKDSKTFNGAAGSYVIEVINKANIKKIAFVDSSGKPLTKQNLNRKETLDLTPCLRVTCLDHTEGTAADVVWSSSNPKAATVSAKGVVTAQAPGKAVIKATSNDGGNKIASCTVTVNQPVEGITLSGPAKVSAGKSITLSANVAPQNATNKNLTWTVAGNDKVTVTPKGKVTAAKDAAGSCTVTATAKDGSAISSAAYTVTILSGTITKITLSDKSVNLFSRQVTKQTPNKKTLTAVVEGNEGFDGKLVEWTSSAPAVASVKNGVVTAHTAGKATITCASTDGSNKKATCTVKVLIPMSKLVIGAAGRNGSGNVAQGKSIRLSAHYYSYHGKPNNTKVTWKSNKEAVAKVDKNGKVTIAKGVAVGSKAVITATAADGSNLVSNSYTITVSKLYKKLKLEPDRSGGWVPVLDGQYIANDYTVSVSGGSNAGCNKAVYKNSYYYLQPIPGRVTTSKSSSSLFITNRDIQQMKLSVTLQDGSNLKASTTVYAARFKNGVVKYYTPKR